MEMYNPTFMRQALSLAIEAYKEDEVPVGCVIVYKNTIVGQGHNTKHRDKCALSHAEIIAIQKASSFLQRSILDDCQMYVTLEPCLMCTGAILQSRIQKVYIGASDPTMGAFISKIPLVKEELIFPSTIDYAFKKTISPYLLKRFFRKIRNKSSLKNDLGQNSKCSK